jgi:hypothetical protein
MTSTLFDCFPMRRRPRWDADGGLWYVSQTVPKDGSPTPMYRHKPTMNSICCPLLGTTVRNPDRTIAGVKYPRFEDACDIYREGLELVHVFRDYSDLFALAMYRRQVSEYGLILDQLFLELARDADFSTESWGMLALRMPEGTPVHEICLRKAKPSLHLVAAE